MSDDLKNAYAPDMDAVMQRGTIARKMYDITLKRSQEEIGVSMLIGGYVILFVLVLLGILYLPFKVSSPATMASSITMDIFLLCLGAVFFADLFVFVGLGRVPDSFRAYKLLPASLVCGTFLWLVLWPLKLVPGLMQGFTGWRSVLGFAIAAALMATWAKRRAGMRVWRGALYLIGDYRNKRATQAASGGEIRQVQPHQPAVPAVAPQPVQPVKHPFALQIGVSTGQLASMGYKAGMEPGKPAVLRDPDMFQNIMVWGGIGSGKTTRQISPLLLQILSQEAGALVFDIKGDFIREMDYLVHLAGRNYQIVGDGGFACNLFAGLTPEVATDFISSAFLLNSTGGASDAGQFFNGTAANLCRSALAMLKFIPGKYSLAGLYEYIFLPEVRNDVDVQIDMLLNSGDLAFDAKRELQMAREFYEHVFQQYEDKVKSNVLATVSRVLTPFRTPAMMDAFCGADDAIPQVEFADMLNRGAVFLVEIPRTKFGKEGSQYAYLFVKLRFMHLMRERRMRRDWNQDRPVAFVCDEYQAIIDAISDTDFWDKSRSARTLGLVSMQGYSSMKQAVGDEKAALSILQNFRQRVCLSTDDIPTIELLGKQAGQADVEKEGASQSEGENTGESQQLAGQMGRSKSSGESSSTSRTYSLQRQTVIDGELFNGLEKGQAVALVKLGNRAFNDVINTKPLYVPDDYQFHGPVPVTRRPARPATAAAVPSPAVQQLANVEPVPPVEVIEPEPVEVLAGEANTMPAGHEDVKIDFDATVRDLFAFRGKNEEGRE